MVTLNQDVVDDIKEEYGLDKLEDVQSEFEDVLVNSNKNFSEAEIFAGSAVASIRYAGFPILASELAGRAGDSVTEDRVLEAVEVINNNSDFIDSSRNIHKETAEEFVGIYTNNYNTSPDFRSGIWKFIEDILWESECYEEFENYDPRVGASTLIWIMGNVTSWDMDPSDLNEITNVMESDPADVIDCYYRIFINNNLFKVKLSALDDTGTLKSVMAIADEFGLESDEKQKLFEGVLLDDLPKDYDNKTRGAIYFAKHSEQSVEDVIEKSSTTKAKYERIKSKLDN